VTNTCDHHKDGRSLTPSSNLTRSSVIAQQSQRTRTSITRAPEASDPKLKIKKGPKWGVLSLHPIFRILDTGALSIDRPKMLAQNWGCYLAPPFFKFWARGLCPKADSRGCNKQGYTTHGPRIIHDLSLCLSSGGEQRTEPYLHAAHTPLRLKKEYYAVRRKNPRPAGHTRHVIMPIIRRGTRTEPVLQATIHL
jgi:hypothetical protein